MGPTQEALALADFLIARYGFSQDRYSLAYSIMEHEEAAMRDMDTPGGREEAVVPTGDIVDSLAQITVARYTLRNSQLPADVREVLKMAARALSHPAESSGGDAVDGKVTEAFAIVGREHGGIAANNDGQYLIFCTSPVAHLYNDDDAEKIVRVRISAAIASGAEHGR